MNESRLAEQVAALFYGIWEFRRSFTTHYEGSELTAYDWGREWAHRLTMRLFE